MPAFDRIIREYKENLDRPARELCDTEEGPPVVSSSRDSTLNNSSETEIENENKSANAEIVSLVPYLSDSDSE